MLSRRIAAGWSELPGVMAGNIIISLSLMATSTPPFISPLSESGEKLPAFSFWKSDRWREREKQTARQTSGSGRRGFSEEVGRCKDVWRRSARWGGGEGGNEESDGADKRGVRGTSQVAIKRETGKGKRELLTAAIICLLPHLSSSKQGCHHLLTSTPHHHHLGLKTLEERRIMEKWWNPKFA